MHGHMNVNLSWCRLTWTSFYHDARSHERQFITMHGHMNVNLSRCTVTWTSIYHDARSSERYFITMHGHLNVILSRCTVTWTLFYHDARSPERYFITMHGHLNIILSRCTVTWTSNSYFLLSVHVQQLHTYHISRNLSLNNDARVFAVRASLFLLHKFKCTYMFRLARQPLAGWMGKKYNGIVEE